MKDTTTLQASYAELMSSSHQYYKQTKTCSLQYKAHLLTSAYMVKLSTNDK